LAWLASSEEDQFSVYNQLFSHEIARVVGSPVCTRNKVSTFFLHGGFFSLNYCALHPGQTMPFSLAIASPEQTSKITYNHESFEAG